jgi:hypothetical protein
MTIDTKIPATAAERQAKRKAKLLADSRDKQSLLLIVGWFVARYEQNEITIAETIEGIKSTLANYE